MRLAIELYRVIFTRSYNLAILICLLAFISPVKSSAENGKSDEKKKDQSIILIHHPEIEYSKKVALLILPGFGDSKKGRKEQQAYFENFDFDLFIPEYINDESFDLTIEDLAQFIDDNRLKEYKELYVFAYIMGSWVINSYIIKYGSANIEKIVYDRSPLQERAPQVIVDRIPRIGKMMAGPVLKEFSTIPYPSIQKRDIKIGIIVESKATKLIKTFRKTAMSYGPIDWNNLDFNQGCDDLIFTRLNHDEMYYSFDEIGSDIIYFLINGVFTDQARREAFDWDPFKKYKKGK